MSDYTLGADSNLVAPGSVDTAGAVSRATVWHWAVPNKGGHQAMSYFSVGVIVRLRNES